MEPWTAAQNALLYRRHFELQARIHDTSDVFTINFWNETISRIFILGTSKFVSCWIWKYHNNTPKTIFVSKYKHYGIFSLIAELMHFMEQLNLWLQNTSFPLMFSSCSWFWVKQWLLIDSSLRIRVVTFWIPIFTYITNWILIDSV